jgi:uncharacterized membrane protein YgaE (UPF0421/DUF939 family)
MAGGAQAARLKRLERNIRRRLNVRSAVVRALNSMPAALQIVVAATAAYALAHYLVGHQFPIVAVTVTISTLGFTRDARPRRVLEVVIGITVGILLAEILLMVAGTGIWQIACVLFVTLVVARLFSPSNAFAIAAGVQSMLVMILPAPDGGVFVRSVDGLIGGVLALIVTALIPRNLTGIVKRDARTLVSTLTESIDTVVDALAHANEPAANLALERLRRTQMLIDDCTQSLESAIAIAKISPFIRRHLPHLLNQERAISRLDLASRHLRIITRRIYFLVRDGVERPAIAALFAQVSAGVTTLGMALEDPTKFGEARAQLEALARELDPLTALPDAAITDAIVVHVVRPLVVDLLVATGMTVDDARGVLPPL